MSTESKGRTGTNADESAAEFLDRLAEVAKETEAEGGEEPVGRPSVAHALKAIVEALVFASPEPVSLKQLVKLLDGEPKEAVRDALAELATDYEHSAGLQLVDVAGGYQIVTRPELHEWVRRLFKERTTAQKLSRAALETLAVVAYKQPITAAEIAEVRGVNTAGVLGTLLDRKLIKIAGRKAVVGRPFMYATTREFLDRFGLSDLSDLPKVEDMSDLLGFDLAMESESPDAAPVALPFDQESETSPSTSEPPAPESSAESSPESSTESNEEPSPEPSDEPERS